MGENDNQQFSGINNLISTISSNSSLTPEEVKALIKKISNVIKIEKKFKHLRNIIKNDKQQKRNTKEIQVVIDVFEKTKNSLKPLQEDIKKLIGEKQYFILTDFIKKSV